VVSPSLWRRSIIVLSAVAVGLIAVVVAKGSAAPPAPNYVLEQDEAEIVSALLSANDGLRDEIERLDREIQAASSDRGSGRLEEMAEALNALRVVNGDVAAVGPGVEVRASGDLTAALLRDLVNELKSAGAEAMAIDGRRLNLWSAIYEGESGVVVDGQTLGNAATLEAIGDAGTMTEALERPGGLVSLLARSGIDVTIRTRTGAEEVVLPVYPEPRAFRFAAGR